MTKANATPGAFLSDDYPNLDFLRSCAVLFVCTSHVLHFFGIGWFWGQRLSVERLGMWGVMIFFVHTCLVLMMSLERQGRNSGFGGFGRMFSSFMIRRCFRIYPLSILAVSTVAFFKLPVAILAPGGGFRAWIPQRPFDIFSNLALIQNLTYRLSILGPLWSLPYEMQMYLLLPIIFVFIASERQALRAFMLWFAGFAVAAVALHKQFSFVPVLYVPCFLPGVLAYCLLKKKLPRMPALLWPLLLAVLTAFAMVDGNRHFLQYWLGALVLGLAIPLFAQFSASWIVEPSRIIARYSYGIYLSHFICIWFAFVYLARYPIALQIGVFLLTFTAAPVILYHAVEEPLIRFGKKVAKRVGSERRSPAHPLESLMEPAELVCSLE